MSPLTFLEPDSFEFPPTALALDDPSGLLAVGGDLSPARLLSAYSLGIFPWYSDTQPIMWWSPDPRMVLTPNTLHLGRSTLKFARKKPFTITVDKDFTSVIEQCAAIPRDGEDGTWITDEMKTAYVRLHQLGYAHSIEAWQNNVLVGGLYGVAIGGNFFGESMFSLVSGASKMAFATLALQLKKWGYACIDCQIYTDYLASFGALEIERKDFEALLSHNTTVPEQETLDMRLHYLTKGDTQALEALKWSHIWTMPEHGFD